MAYKKRNNQERLPKKEYFALRLEQAIQDGLTDKADYYRSRISQLEEERRSEVLTREIPKPKFLRQEQPSVNHKKGLVVIEERVSLEVAGLFGSRDTLQEAFDYADMMAQSSESPIQAITPVYVLYNTIAKQYDLVPKITDAK